MSNLSDLFKYDIIITDLDFTLWDGKHLYPGVKSLLRALYENHKTIYIATYNTKCSMVCCKLGIADYLCGFMNNRECSKAFMVETVLHHHVDTDRKKIIFLDDKLSNIIEVHKAHPDVCYRHITADNPFAQNFNQTN